MFVNALLDEVDWERKKKKKKDLLEAKTNDLN